MCNSNVVSNGLVQQHLSPVRLCVVKRGSPSFITYCAFVLQSLIKAAYAGPMGVFFFLFLLKRSLPRPLNKERHFMLHHKLFWKHPLLFKIACSCRLRNSQAKGVLLHTSNIGFLPVFLILKYNTAFMSFPFPSISLIFELSHDVKATFRNLVEYSGSLTLISIFIASRKSICNCINLEKGGSNVTKIGVVFRHMQ